MIAFKATKIAAIMLCGAALACGEDAKPPVAPGASMSAGTQETREVEKTSESKNAGNSAPQLKGLRFEPRQPAAGEPLRVIADTFDADGDAVGLSYVWSYQGKEVRGDSEQMTFVQSKKNDWIEVTVTPNDGKDEGQPMTAETRVANRAPSAVSLRMEPTHKIQAGTPIVARPYSRDFDGDPVLFTYTWTVNGLARSQVSGDTLDTTGLKRGDVVQVSVVGSDGDAESPPVLSEELTIQNAPPEIVSKPSSPDEDGAFVYQIEVEDEDDRRFSYRLGRSPEGMDLDLVSGRIEWKPSADQTGAFPVEIIVEDRSGGTARQSFELTIGASQNPQGSPASLPN